MVLLKVCIFETDSKKVSKLLSKVKKYEEITDRVEQEAVEFLSKVSEGQLSEDSSIHIRGMMSIAGDLENIEIFIFKCPKNIGKKKGKKILFYSKTKE